MIKDTVNGQDGNTRGFSDGKYRVVIFKAYFDKGLSLTSYLKYILFLVAFADILWVSQDIFFTIVGGFAYALFCLVLGFVWFKYGWYETEQEVINRFNLFVREVRDKLK